MKTWSKIAAMVVTITSVVIAHAKEIEQISVVENESITITAPFAVKSFAPSNKDVAKIDALGGTSLRVTALKRGRCDLDVSGDNGLTQKYEITVVGDLASVLETLTMDLDTVPEVRAEIRGNFIRLDGEVSSIQKWEYLTKVIANYGNSIKNFAKFYPGPEILLRLKDTLEQAEFKVQFKRFEGDYHKWPYRTVALDLNKKTRVLNVQARLLNEQQRVSILSILKSEPWLSVNVDDDWKKPVDMPEDKAPYAISTLLGLYIDKPVIRLSVAYMAIGESDLDQIGNPNAVQGNGVLGLDGAFGVLREFVHGTTVNTRGQSIGASLDVTARFLKQNGISRVSDTGYTLLESWDPEGAKFKSGGTRYVKTGGANGPGSTFVGNSDVKEIPYGFIINAKGGLLDETTMSCDFDFSISTIVYLLGEDSYDRKEDTSKQKISLPIGRTTLIGGFKDMVDKNTPPSGLPVLRNTPILNWFVAESGKSVTDRRLVMMVCPEIVDNTQDVKPDVDKEINIRVQDQGSKTTDEVIEERKPFSGFWSWLNWFTF
ncbi:MAG: hypothetical protein IJG18_11070 [Kiritimatiellae bacterium]|nr:hypothetical protein [Kiritimatiellia bacterium]